MWIAKVELAKGLNTTRHDALWNALARFEVETPYISLLKRLHADRQAAVLTDKESDMFKIQRVTKQGGLEFFFVQHGASGCFGRRHEQLARERHGHQFS